MTINSTSGERTFLARILPGVGAALILSTIATLAVLKIKKTVAPSVEPPVGKTIVFKTADIGDMLWMHGALTNGGICSSKGCQLTLGITNRLSEPRRNVLGYWGRVIVRVSDASGVVLSVPLRPLGEGKQKIADQISKQPEFFNLADFSSILSSEELGPNELSVREIFFFSEKPDLQTIRANTGMFKILDRAGKYRLEVVFLNNNREQVIFVYPDLLVL